MQHNSQIKELRKSAKLDEALELANTDLQASPDDIWAKRSIAWVYYEFLKKYVESGDFDNFIIALKEIRALNLPREELMFFNNVIWPITAMFRFLLNQQQPDVSKLGTIYDIIKDFPFEKPGDNFSILFNIIHKAFKNDAKYLGIIDQLGLENLSPNDYKEEEFNGRKIMALAEQVYIAYAKHLENGTLIGSYNNEKMVDSEAIARFLPKLECLIEQHPDYVYPPYFKAKLLLAVGGDDIMQSFLPFAKLKRNDYWVWQLMSEIYKDNEELVFSCLAKALSLRSPDAFLVKIRQTFTERLIDRKMYDEAKTEIEQIVAVKTKENNRIPFIIDNWKYAGWYQSAALLNNNRKLYDQYKGQAEELLYRDIPEEIIVIEFVNHDKQIINFVKDKNKIGFFKYNHLLKNPKIGDLLKVRFSNNDGNRYQVITIEKGNDMLSEAKKPFEGILKTIAAGIGFVDQIFIEKSLIEKAKLENGANVNGAAILSYNKKKEEWGWKAIEIYL